eukprot:g7113.t1
MAKLRKRGSWERSNSDVNDALQKRRDEAYTHVEGDLHNGTIPLPIKLAYCMPTVSTLPINVLLAVYISSFYEKMGADLGYISLFIALARSFDVLSDPAMSYITDSCRTKFGRRRPFMLTGCIPYGMLLMLLLGPPPGMTATNTALWFGITYILFYLLGTYCNIPYDSLGPELTDNYEDRNRLFFISGLFDGIGSLLGIMSPIFIAILVSSPDSLDVSSCELDSVNGVRAKTVTTGATCVEWSSKTFDVNQSQYAPLFSHGNYSRQDCASDKPLFNSSYCLCVDACKAFNALDSERKAFSYVGICFGAWYIITMMNCVFWLRERSQKPGGGKLPKPAPMVPSMLNTMENVAFTSLLPAWACDAIFTGILSSMLMYFVRYVVVPEYQPGCNDGLNTADWKCSSTHVAGLSVTMLLISAFLGTPLWLFIAGKLGKRKTWLLWSFTSAITNFLFIFVGEGDVMLNVGVAALNGLPMGAKFLADAINADIIDYDEFLTGQRSEATYTMFKSFLPKICAIPASAIPLALLNMVGHVPPKNGIIQRQPESVKTYVITVSVWIGSTLSFIAFLLKFRFPLKTKEQCDLISQGVGHHMKNEPALDPISNRDYELEEFKPEEMEELYLLNNFLGLDVLRGLKSNYKRKSELLYKRMICASITGLLVFFLAAALAGYTVSQNWLNDPRLSFIPILAIICVGGALTYMCFNILRLCAAKELKDRSPIDPLFIERVLVHRENIHQIFAFAKSGANKVAPDNKSIGDDDDVQMGNSLYSDMIGAKTEKEEDDEMHGKGQISYKDYVEDQAKEDEKNVMVI